MKKILFIADINSIHTIKWINFFANQFDISVISTNILKNSSLVDKKIKIYIFKKYSNKFLNILHLAELFILMKKIRKNYDIVHVHYLGFHIIIALFFKSSFISTIWGSDLKINKSNFLKKYFINKFLHKSNFITTDSFEIQELLIKQFKVQKEKIKIINFGIDTNFFIKKNYNKEFASKYNLKRDDLTVVSFRGHEYIYNIETLIRSVAIASKKIKIKCLIFNMGKKTEDYIQLSNEMGLENNVLFAGKYEQKDIPDILSVCDVYVSTSLSDGGIAASTAEAMSCEVPCIITNNSDNKYWINDEENGFLFSNQNYNELASKLLNLNFFDIKKIGKNARKTILDRNDYNHEMLKMKSIYKCC
jgi:glycosyltransferase involved in cell wall biosynthesis